MDKDSSRPPKPWVPPGWKVYWSKRKTQWYWASPSKKTYWALPEEMKEPPELPLSEKTKPVAQTKNCQTRASKRRRDEDLIEEVAKQPLNKEVTKPSTNKEVTKPEPAIPRLKKKSKKVESAEVGKAGPEVGKAGPEVGKAGPEVVLEDKPKLLDNHDISRMLSSLASIPGLGSSKSRAKPEEVLVVPPLDLSSLQQLPSSETTYDPSSEKTNEAPIAAPLSPHPLPSSYGSHSGSGHGSHSGSGHGSHSGTLARGHHYSERAQALGNRTRDEREDTPSIRMCKHNNWIKSILLEAAALVFGEGFTFNAMDLACGRGGDLHKWRKVVKKFKQGIGVFYGIDNAPKALAHARDVRSKQLPSSTQSHWLQEDLEQLDLFARLSSQGLIQPGMIHLASMQFALHYFFRSEAALSAVFRLLASSMAEGGIFVTTYTDGNAIVRLAREQRWKDAVEEAKRSGGGPVYEKGTTRVSSDLFHFEISAETLKAIEVSPDPFGHAFSFSLDNAVRNQREYLVVDSVLDQVAQSFGFHTVLEENFQPLTHDMMRVGSHQELMRIMKVFGQKPEFHQGEWDAIGLYKTRIFVKDTRGMLVPKAKEWIHRYLF